jgi:2-iminobutanoate/2-iminopropanoate deaminase
MKPPHLSPSAEGGGLVFLSGQLPFGAGGALVGENVAEQTAQALANIDALLGKLGLVRTDILKTTVWLRPGSDFATFNDTYADFFGNHRPARSTVFSDLALPSATVEIEAIAIRKT